MTDLVEAFVDRVLEKMLTDGAELEEAVAEIAPFGLRDAVHEGVSRVRSIKNVSTKNTVQKGSAETSLFPGLAGLKVLPVPARSFSEPKEIEKWWE